MSMNDYLIAAVKHTLEQLLLFAGPLLLFALLMNLIATRLERTSIALVGTKAYLVIFGWLGTAFHELSHAVFALLFGHKIDKIQLFKPDKETGTLGYVKHSYNPRNLFHQLGNFFIGVGPVLMGAAAIFALLYLIFGIVPNDFPVFTFSNEAITTETIRQWATQFPEGLSVLFSSVFHNNQVRWWHITLMFYLLLSIGSSITLSRSDVKTAFWGLLMMVFLSFLFNLSTGWMEGFSEQVFRSIGVFISLFSAIMIMALLLNIAMLALMSLFLMLKRAVFS